MPWSRSLNRGTRIRTISRDALVTPFEPCAGTRGISSLMDWPRWRVQRDALQAALPHTRKPTSGTGSSFASRPRAGVIVGLAVGLGSTRSKCAEVCAGLVRLEEHTSELQSQSNFVC